MDFLHFISHLQKRVRSGGPNNRIHGIGQGHDASVVDTLAGDPSADLPTDAASGYMNADMLDGYHAKQVYQGKAPALYSGLNADTLDGVDKSLGHVEGALNFNSTDGTAATAAITFSGTPKQNDVVTLKLYGPNGTQIGADVTANISQAAPTLEDVRTAVKNAITANATVLAAFTNNGADSDSGSNEVLTLTTAQKGPRANLYLLVVSITNAAQSSLAVDKTHGVYRFSGGGPEEGINADKLDDLHAREHYHALEAQEPSANFVVKPPPLGRGINADTLDSFHGREAYHGIVPDKGTGLNADTLDGVHKLFGHKKDSGNPTAGVAYIELGNNPQQGAVGTKVKLTLFGTDGRTPTGINAIEFTASAIDGSGSAVDNIGQNLNSSLNSSWSSYVTSEWKSDTNILVLTAVKAGERNQYSILVEVTDKNSATAAEKFTFRKVNFTAPSTVTAIPGEVYTTSARISLVGVNTVLGIDADMLDGIHAASGHFAEARDVEGQFISRGINADLLDGLHARIANKNNTDTVHSEINSDDNKTVKTDDPTKPYLPVADGINTNNNTPTHEPKNPNLDADTVDGYQASELLAAKKEIVNPGANPDTKLILTDAGPLSFYSSDTPNNASPVFTVDTTGVVKGLGFTGTNITSGQNTVYWTIKPSITSTITPEIVVTDYFGDLSWAFTFRPFTNSSPTLESASWTASTFANQAAWESASKDQRGYVKLLANGTKYQGTSVDHADKATTLLGYINYSQIANPPALSAEVETSRRIATYKKNSQPGIAAYGDQWKPQVRGYVRLSTFKTSQAVFDGDINGDVEWTISTEASWTVIGAMTMDAAGTGGLKGADGTGVQESNKIYTNSSTANGGDCFISVWMLEPGADTPDVSGWSP